MRSDLNFVELLKSRKPFGMNTSENAVVNPSKSTLPKIPGGALPDGKLSCRGDLTISRQNQIGGQKRTCAQDQCLTSFSTTVLLTGLLLELKLAPVSGDPGIHGGRNPIEGSSWVDVYRLEQARTVSPLSYV